MKVHYFQRYNTKENVATANTMLLLSRLYAYSSTKFFTFLKNEFFSDSINLELNFDLQVKDGYLYGFDLKNVPHRYFFVEQFYETDFKKISLRAPMGPRLFDLTQVLEKEEIPPVEVLAEELKKKTWM